MAFDPSASGGSTVSGGNRNGPCAGVLVVNDSATSATRKPEKEAQRGICGLGASGRGGTEGPSAIPRENVLTAFRRFREVEDGVATAGTSLHSPVARCSKRHVRPSLWH